MIGVVRCEARYAMPRSRMNRAGEWVSRPVPRLFVPGVGEGAADDLDPRRDALDGVVRAGEQALVADRRGVLAGRAELR